MLTKFIYVFGDSFSDTGNSFQFTNELSPLLAIPPSPPYYLGRFSNGPVAVELLPLQLVTFEQANNFAFGGARTGRGNSNEDDLGGVDLPGLLDQIDAFAASVGSSGANPNGLYLVGAGTNDFLDTLAGIPILNDAIVADPAGLISQARDNLITAITNLENLGAKTFVLLNLPNLARLPFIRIEGVPREASAISRAFNASVSLEVNNLRFTGSEANVIEVDLFGALESVAANPSDFGFTNVTDPLLFVPNYPINPPNPQEYFFWDLFHPTTQGHEVFAATISQTISGLIPQPSFNNILGTNRRDILIGTVADDNFDGFAGHDLIWGSYGNDRIEGWSGNDWLFGGQGDDIFNGGDCNDWLFGGQGDDIGFGGLGHDHLFGQAGEDILIGDSGNDWLFGGQGDDYILGGDGNDHLFGDIDRDILNGGPGQDLISGGFGHDRLDGGIDNDWLIGGRGIDQFVYRPGNGNDVIRDFQLQETIDLISFGFDNFEDFTSRVALIENVIDFGFGNTLQLLNIDVSSLTAANFIF